MKCRECSGNMYLDDKDIHSKGNFDRYWNCESCMTGCVEKVMGGKPVKEYWHSENDVVKDYEINL